MLWRAAGLTAERPLPLFAAADEADYGAEPDVVFDLEVTPNRPDLNSVIGIAREIVALTGMTMKTQWIL